jgi:uncharacterized membrane protein
MSNLPEMVSTESRAIAAVSYASVLTGLPLFLIPLIMRKDEFAIHHAKQAAEIYAAFFLCVSGYAAISLFTLGLGSLFCFPMIFLPYIPMVHGLLLSLNNEWKAPIGVFGIGDSILSGIRADQR